jgi:hypothetical protein
MPDLRLVAVATLIGSGSVQAHPSYAMFDMSTTLQLTGIVERFDYTIPHSWLHIVVTDNDGEVKHWALEMDGVPELYRQGIKSDSVYPGLGVTVLLNPMRGNRPSGLWRGHVDSKGGIFGEWWQE